MNHYLFTCEESGEEFIVGAATLCEAFKIAIAEFGDSTFEGELSDEEAECSGLDEY